MKRGIDSGLFFYCRRIGPKKIIEWAVLSALVLVALIGSSMAPTPSGSLVGPGSYEEKNINFYVEQSAQGNGYFMNYMYAVSGNTAVKNYAHGSGSINNEAF